MKKLLSILLALLMVFSLAACNQGGGNSANAGGNEQPAEKTKVTVWHTYTEGQLEYLEKAIADFNASQELYEVVAESQPYDVHTVRRSWPAQTSSNP